MTDIKTVLILVTAAYSKRTDSWKYFQKIDLKRAQYINHTQS